MHAVRALPVAAPHNHNHPHNHPPADPLEGLLTRIRSMLGLSASEHFTVVGGAQQYSGVERQCCDQHVAIPLL